MDGGTQQKRAGAHMARTHTKRALTHAHTRPSQHEFEAPGLPGAHTHKAQRALTHAHTRPSQHATTEASRLTTQGMSSRHAECVHTPRTRASAPLSYMVPARRPVHSLLMRARPHSHAPQTASARVARSLVACYGPSHGRHSNTGKACEADLTADTATQA